MVLKDNQNRTIVLYFNESSYASFMEDHETTHKMIRDHFQKYPELFPQKITAGYMLNGKTRVSKKLGIQMRKILVNGISY